MLLGHRVVNGDKILVFHFFYGKGIVGIFCFQSRKCNTAAADQGISQTVDHIAANGTHIEFAPEHIAGDVLIVNMLTIHQFNDGNAQSLR